MLANLKTLLTTLASVGIEEAVIENPEDENVEVSRIRGANKEGNIIVFHDIDGVFFPEAPMGTQTVKGLLSRIELFDESKAEVLHTVTNGVVKNLTIKQGRKKASFTCSDPKNLTLPAKVPAFDMDNQYVLTSEMIALLNAAISAMSMTGSKADRYLSIGVKDSVMSVNIFDGEDDSFNDEFQLEDGVDDAPTFSWDVPAFHRVMRESESANSGSAVFNVSKHGIAIFNIGMVNVLLPPNRHNK